MSREIDCKHKMSFANVSVRNSLAGLKYCYECGKSKGEIELEENTKHMLRWLDMYWEVYEGNHLPKPCPVCVETGNDNGDHQHCEENAWDWFEKFRKLVEQGK